jgi:quinol monooxygenase YgiN
VRGLASGFLVVHDAQVYVSLSRLRVDVSRSDELQVWRSDHDAGEVIMVSRWRDRDAFRAYMRSADHRASHARMDASLKESIHLERLEQLHTYDVVAE